MASVKNRNTYRASGLDKSINSNTFTRILENHLTDAEKTEFIITCARSHVTLSPVEKGTKKTAIFQISLRKPPPPDEKPRVPSFLAKTPRIIGKEPNDKNGSIYIDADFDGITQLYDVEERNIALDVVALSGLNGHAFGSWTCTPDGGELKMWLRDFLHDEPDLGQQCRVMIYGYNTKYEGKAEPTMADYTANFLEELKKARSREQVSLDELV
ncbi:hypothetical protein ABW19_dt0210563 [Dactylella cylindrospora]|nr:hypothetical protein ABW19_dt0210563 [Dactylella cylindrospora]